MCYSDSTNKDVSKYAGTALLPHSIMESSMRIIVKKTSDIFLYCFAVFLIVFAIFSIITGSEQLDMLALIASVTGVLFTAADLFSCIKEGNEKFLSLFDEMSEKLRELRSLKRMRIRKMLEYCQFKYDYELSLPESIKADRIALLTTYKKALEILAPIDKVLDPILKDKKPCEIEFTLAIDRRRKMLRLLGMLRNAFLAAGSMSIFVLLYLYKFQPISSKVPNFLTVLSFGLVFLVYALRGQAEEALDEAEKYVRETISESEESMANERIHIKRIEAAMCPEPITLQKDADARILIFLMNIIGADDVGEP